MLKVTKTSNECEQERKENIEDKGENAGLQHFLLFLQSFQKEFSSMVNKIWIVL